MATSPRLPASLVLPPSLPLSRLVQAPPCCPSPRCQCLVPRKLSAEVRTEHARRRRAGPGVRKRPNSACTSHQGRTQTGNAFSEGPGRATWVLAGSLLAAALTCCPRSPETRASSPAGAGSQHPWACGLRVPPRLPGRGLSGPPR